MVIVSVGQAYALLQVLALTPDGSAKLDVVTASVRVYNVSGLGVETNSLAPTALVRVGSSSTWRYVWSGVPALPVGQYVAEYTLTDSDGVVTVQDEDFVVQPSLDLPDITILRKVETNRWKLDTNALTMTVYDDDGVTPLLVFNLLDQYGNPNVVNVFERVPTS